MGDASGVLTATNCFGAHQVGVGWVELERFTHAPYHAGFLAPAHRPAGLRAAQAGLHC
jgi:hypothetical protein